MLQGETLVIYHVELGTLLMIAGGVNPIGKGTVKG